MLISIQDIKDKDTSLISNSNSRVSQKACLIGPNCVHKASTPSTLIVIQLHNLLAAFWKLGWHYLQGSLLFCMGKKMNSKKVVMTWTKMNVVQH